MKTITTILLLLLSILTISAQEETTTILYSYDSAGNRIARCLDGSKSANGGETQDGKPTLEELFAMVDKTEKDENTKEQNEHASLEINVYPNPTTDRISVSKTVTGEYKNTETTYILLDSKGKILDRIISTELLVTFQASHLAKGLYYVYFISGDDERKAWQVVKE